MEKGVLEPLAPNCSEAVMKFYTTDPKEMQKILQWIADEISTNTGFEGHQGQKIPLLKAAKEYDTNWPGEMAYSGEESKKHKEEITKIWKDRDSGITTQEEAIKKFDEIEEKIRKKSYPNSMLKACAGLGDNDAVITVQKDGFVLNIGNNDISQDTTKWTGKVEKMGIKVSEAEYSKELMDKARDCCCGITFFDGYGKLIKDKK